MEKVTGSDCEPKSHLFHFIRHRSLSLLFFSSVHISPLPTFQLPFPFKWALLLVIILVSVLAGDKLRKGLLAGNEKGLRRLPFWLPNLTFDSFLVNNSLTSGKGGFWGGYCSLGPFFFFFFFVMCIFLAYFQGIVILISYFFSKESYVGKWEIVVVKGIFCNRFTNILGIVKQYWHFFYDIWNVNEFLF